MSSNQSQLCPECDAPITSDAINITEGVALCTSCGKLSRLAEVNTSGRTAADIIAHPPAGCSVVIGGMRIQVTLSMRSFVGFMATAFFSLFWNSITAIFVLIAIAGLYANLVGPIPAWFPAPGLKNGKPEMNGAPMDLGQTLFLCVFLIPFVTIGLGMIAAALMNVIGKVEVVIDPFDSYVASGIGFLRWKKRFNPQEVEDVNIVFSQWQSDNGRSSYIEIKGKPTITFGMLLTAERVTWLHAVLKDKLLKASRLRK